MNFLEELAAEWYEYSGYFVRTNVKFGRRARGSYIGEMDVVGYKPETQEFIHIETSTDALTWEQRRRRFERKFTDARKYYMDIFPFKQMNMSPKQIAILGFNLRPSSRMIPWKSTAPKRSILKDIQIEVIHIPEFLRRINNRLKDKDPQKNAIPETYPLLRAIQYSAFYNKSV